jgi:hypothetical protein
MADSTRISDLVEVDEDDISSGSFLPIAVNTNARKITLAAFVAFLETLLTLPGDKEQLFDAPSASPSTTTVEPTVDGGDVWLILTPTETIADGTIALPPGGDAQDGQEVVVVSTQEITALTVSATDLNVTGAPTTLAANGYFTMKFTASTDTWYRIA